MGERLRGENTKYEGKISYTSERRSDIKYIFIEGFFLHFIIAVMSKSVEAD